MSLTRGVLPACVAVLVLSNGGDALLAAQGTRSTRDTLAHLFLVSAPSGKIAVDDSIVGVTPKSLDVRAGTRRIRVSREGYLPYEATIAIEAGETLRITDIILKQKPKSGS